VIIHKNGMVDKDVENVGSLRVTTMLKTVADLQKAGVTVDELEDIGAQAVEARQPAPSKQAKGTRAGGPVAKKAGTGDDSSWGGARAW
jgi:hypothetical protein